MKLLYSVHGTRWAQLACLITALTIPSSFAVDVTRAILLKEIEYDQTTDTPIPEIKNGAVFQADVKAIASNRVTTVSIKLPNSAADILPADGSDEFKLKKKYDKQSSLDANFPSGSYSLGISTAHDGLKTYVLALTGDLYPNTPRVSNLAALQTLDSGTYIVCAWDLFTGGSADDLIQLHIDDSQGNKVWETPDLNETGALDGRARSVLIPARALPTGQALLASLIFGKVTTRDRTTYPGALGAALYSKRTKFTVQTVPNETRAAVKFYAINKSRRYEQKDNSAPTLEATKPDTFDVYVEATSAGAVTKASLVLPSGAPQALSLQPDGKTLEQSSDALLQSGLDASYPNGTYTFQINAATGLSTPALKISGDAYPLAPHLLEMRTSVNGNEDINIRWDPFVGGTSDDFIQLHIENDQGNKVFETADFGKSGALNGTALETTVPAQTLSPGKTYSARVVFQKNVVVDTTSYPGALGLASYGTRTNFKLTTGDDTTPAGPQLALLPASNRGEVRLLVTAPAGRTIALQSSSDLRRWQTIKSSTMPPSGSLTVTDFSIGIPPARFYRAMLPP